jgi:hypothetical protein
MQWGDEPCRLSLGQPSRSRLGSALMCPFTRLITPGTWSSGVVRDAVQRGQVTRRHDRHAVGRVVAA